MDAAASDKFASAPPAESATQRRRRLAVTVAAGVVAAILAAGAVVWVVKTFGHPSSSATERTEPWIQGERLCDSVRQDSGYIRIPSTVDGHYFYWLFESRTKPADAPLVLWVSEGPGCSGLWSLLTENGPCRVQENLSTTVNPYSWNTNATLLYVDQPLFTGFSYGTRPDDYDTNSTVVGERLYGFLQGFFERHPGLRQRELFLAGEGYAGQFIPVAAYTINGKNDGLDERNATLRINLAGVAIGNGLTMPSLQYKHYLDMGTNNSYGISLATPSTISSVDANAVACYSYLEQCQSSIGACVDATIRCGKDLLPVFANTSRNAFDIRQSCSSSSPRDCYATPEVDAFLNSPAVRRYLSVRENATWIQCNKNVSRNFFLGGDMMKDRHRYLGRLLAETDLRVLVYAGDADLSANWIGIDAWTKQLLWPGKNEFNEAQEQDFITSNGTKAGKVRAVSTKFAFVRIFQSGRLVAGDQPEVALEMLGRFLRNSTWGG